jgi:hypothetical protein
MKEYRVLKAEPNDGIKLKFRWKGKLRIFSHQTTFRLIMVAFLIFTIAYGLFLYFSYRKDPNDFLESLIYIQIAKIIFFTYKVIRGNVTYKFVSPDF